MQPEPDAEGRYALCWSQDGPKAKVKQARVKVTLTTFDGIYVDHTGAWRGRVEFIPWADVIELEAALPVLAIPTTTSDHPQG